MVTDVVRVPSGARNEVMPRIWAKRYRARLVVTDAIMVAAAGLLAAMVFPEPLSPFSSDSYLPTSVLVSIALMLVWLPALHRSRCRHVLGFGSAEYLRVLGGSAQVLAVAVISSYLLGWQVGRAYLFVVGTLGSLFLIAGRHLARRSLRRRRSAGKDKSAVVLVGPVKKVERLIEEFHRRPETEFQVIGACVSPAGADSPATIGNVPVLGGTEAAAEVASTLGAQMVVVAGSDAVTSDTVRRLGWDLEGTGIDLALTTALLDVSGSRVQLHPMDAMQMLYVHGSRFSGPKYLLKSVFDWVVGFALLCVFSPILIAVAVAVRVTSPGQVFYVQQRVGRNGRLFEMIKFRSMVVDADRELEALLAAEGREMELFYKPRYDPRVTPLGRFIRKYSLDELPQLFNVLRGEMSLVGPRPQIPAEVALYDRAARRRLLVKPGLTGLWQVSGRSDLTGSEAIRLDLRYAENWSMLGDLSILARTLKVMIHGDGAW